MEEELIKIMAFIRDERTNVLGEEDEEKAQRLDEALSEVHKQLNKLATKETK